MHSARRRSALSRVASRSAPIAAATIPSSSASITLATTSSSSGSTGAASTSTSLTTCACAAASLTGLALPPFSSSSAGTISEDDPYDDVDAGDE